MIRTLQVPKNTLQIYFINNLQYQITLFVFVNVSLQRKFAN